MAKRLKMTKSVLGNDRDRVGPVEAWVDKEGDLVLNAPAVYVSPEQWQALVAAVEVVDGPTPGERLALELVAEGLIIGTPGRTVVGACERIAARLGITEGGE